MTPPPLVVAGLTLLALVTGPPAWAQDPANQAIHGVKQNIGAVPIPHNPAKTRSPPSTSPLCPKLVAVELHVANVMPLHLRADSQTFRFVLDGTVANHGAAGLAAARLKVTQRVPGKPETRIALKVLKQPVRRNQSFGLNRDLHVSIQSDGLNRAQAGRVTFELQVTNLRDDHGNCGERNPTLARLTSTRVSRALPARIAGIGQGAGGAGNGGKPPVKGGFAPPALSSSALPGLPKPVAGLERHTLSKQRTAPPPVSAIDKSQPAAPAYPAIGGIPHPAGSAAGSGPPAQTRKRTSGFVPAPSPGAAKSTPDKARGGFAPAGGFNPQASSAARPRKAEYSIVPGGSLSMTGMGNGYSSSQIHEARIAESVPFVIAPGGSLAMTGVRENALTIAPGGSLLMTGLGNGDLSSQVHEATPDGPMHFVIAPGGKMTMTGMRITTIRTIGK